MSLFGKIFRGLTQDVAFFAQLRVFFFELADPFGIIRRLGFIMHGFNAGTFAGAVLLDPRMKRGTVDTELS